MNLTRTLSLTVLLLFSVLKAAQAASPVYPQTADINGVTHTVHSVQMLDAIPESWTLEKYRVLARSKPAKPGHVWFVIKGESHNGTQEKRSLGFTGVFIRDEQDNKYRISIGTLYYQPAETILSNIPLAAGATRDWAGFFQVPTAAKGLVLNLSDATPGGRKYVSFPLQESAAATAESPTVDPGETAETKPAKPAAAPAMPLRRHVDDTVAASLLLPEGFEAVEKGQGQRGWKFRSDDGAALWSVNLSTLLQVSDMQQALGMATLIGGPNVAAAKRLKNGYLVVKQPMGESRDVWMFSTENGRRLAARCNGPAGELRTLLYICASLKADAR